jgi:hypothetical protein
VFVTECVCEGDSERGGAPGGPGGMGDADSESKHTPRTPVQRSPAEAGPATSFRVEPEPYSSDHDDSSAAGSVHDPDSTVQVN